MGSPSKKINQIFRGHGLYDKYKSLKQNKEEKKKNLKLNVFENIVIYHRN